jgi:hypothetical protein
MHRRAARQFVGFVPRLPLRSMVLATQPNSLLREHDEKSSVRRIAMRGRDIAASDRLSPYSH